MARRYYLHIRIGRGRHGGGARLIRKALLILVFFLSPSFLLLFCFLGEDGVLVPRWGLDVGFYLPCQSRTCKPASMYQPTIYLPTSPPSLEGIYLASGK